MTKSKENNQDKESTGSSKPTMKKAVSKNVKVINVPHKKKPLRTPSHILRLCIVWAYVICIFLLTSSFMEARIYITDDLKTTLNPSEANLTPASQEEITKAEEKLQSAIDGLEKKKDKDQEDTAVIESIATANYNWQYHVADGISYRDLMKLIDQAMDIDRSKYTEKSITALNEATIYAHKTLCASVKISQSAFQMMLGGAISESYGYETGASAVTHSFFSFSLAVIPTICFFAATFDKRRHIKHIIGLVGSFLCLADIMFTIYPYIGIGATLSIILYFLICVMNIASIYAKQQEDYIVKHPELEAEFGAKHPHFVKALINEKTFGHVSMPTNHEKELSSAKNAKKRGHRRKK